MYVAGLPSDVTEDELRAHFAKCGVLAVDPLTSAPKIRLYRDEEGHPKGDCSICYANAESVALAEQILDGGMLRYGFALSVKRAEFKLKGEAFDPAKRQRVNATQARVARAAEAQARSWNEDDDSGAARKASLRIVVLENMFTPADCAADGFGEALERELVAELEAKVALPEKVTLFSRSERGVVVVKFRTGYAAEDCIKLMDGRYFGGARMRCYYWDGVTNFDAGAGAGDDAADEEEDARHTDFGDWLDEQEVPEELQLRVEGGA